ncbi:MAG: hypothetical protein CMD74_02500 [Gammaproteobacteria bacterium]|nr:hypothetical protein [Gammaproteobacteria bacterium]
MTVMIFVRHGQIRANKKGLWHGSTDSSLTLKGHYQAARTAKHLANKQSITKIYSSPLKRCVNTARHISKSIKIPILIDENIREYAIGDWEGLPFKVLQEKYDFVNRVQADPDFRPPNGESLKGVSDRMSSFIDRVREDNNRQQRGDILIVSHGAAISVALAKEVDHTCTAWMKYHISNCSITELQFLPDAVLTKFNEVSHLRLRSPI